MLDESRIEYLDQLSFDMVNQKALLKSPGVGGHVLDTISEILRLETSCSC